MMIALAIILLAAAQAADYFYQADLHGWVNPLWKNKARADKWEWPVKIGKRTFVFSLDWIPHDGWHIAQTLRNFGDAVGVSAGVIAAAQAVYGSAAVLGINWHTLVCLALSLAVRALLRGLFFSGLYRYLKARPELGK